jgi:ADP-ribosyl-[dinitrogen reductase] hydrolase
LFGLAVGEGLAIASREQTFSDARWSAEAKRIEHLPAGADTAMTLAVAESLLERGGHDTNDQLKRYVSWTQQPAAQSRVPPELKRVLAVWQWSRKPNPGSHDPKNLDPHPLARTLAAVLWTKGDVDRAADAAFEIARTTLQSPLVLDAARLWAATLASALKGDAKTDLLALKAAQAALRQRQVKPQIAALLAGDWRRTEPIDGAPSLLANVLDIFRATNSFESAIREAVRGGSTFAALVGSLAGAYYGSQAIPLEWRRAVPDSARLAQLVSRFAT